MVVPSGRQLRVKHGPRPSIGILQTCRALRNEAVPVFYGTNTFKHEWHHSTSYQLSSTRLDELSPLALGSIRKLHLSVTFGCPGGTYLHGSAKIAVSIDRDNVNDPFTCVIGQHVSGFVSRWQGTRWQSTPEVCVLCEPPVNECHQTTALLGRLTTESRIKELSREDLKKLFSAMCGNKYFGRA